MMLAAVQKELESLGDASRAKNLQRFFKTGPGEYAAGDRFRGLRVPVLRKLAKKYQDLSVAEAEVLLKSPWHEDRLLALFILIRHYYGGGQAVKDEIHRLYLRNTRWVNNWDLVDASAPHLLGHYLADRDRDTLTRLAASQNLWERRMTIIATLYFIKQQEYDETLKIAGLLLGDPEDLIHKAVGWMLREVEKRENAVAEAFLQAHYRQMPRTMLRYAIERLPEDRRQAYLKGEV
ncbi:MAG: DNA alkylation repair protein [Syntrophales bacterium]|nr:DNA alkylation repair protein [Syntrophales bacterium]MDD5642847.1 DNA alkylation repair protein [Syntrophales bacterium]